uniref:PHD-type domain-containing protein n=1 Tax=Panagrolaimus superbus TaxID=310955 RepID=A0A914YWF8_9BILA
MPFRRRKPDPSIKDSDKVWYIESTNEVFTNYDDFFDRYIQMNSMCWTCPVTGKSGLTFEEAKESEREAVKAVEDSFPKALAVPLLWLAHTYCYRGRCDDLVNDVYVVSRDRYFIGETVWYQQSEAQRFKGRIVGVEYDATKAIAAKKDKKDLPKKEEHHSEDEDAANQSATSKKKSVIKPEDPEVPNPECYTYSFLPFENDGGDAITDIEHSAISRPKAVGSRVKMRLFMRKLTELRGNKVVLSKSTIEQYQLTGRHWEEFFTGPLPDFPKSERRKPFGYINENKRKAESPPQSPVVAKKQRASKSTGGKVKKEVQQQQDLLKDVFEQARSLQIEDLPKWEQNQRVLSDAEIDELKEAIKIAQEDKREREKDRKKLEKEAAAAHKRPRDDLQCDDLKPLPELKFLQLPSYLTPESFSQVLSISQFFYTFSNFFEDIEITLKDCILALYQNGGKNDSLVKILTALLKCRAICVEKEDGDEANPKVDNEMSNETYAVFNNKKHGGRIAELNKLHEKYRTLHGIAPPFLTVNWVTISEVLRLNLIISGYCPMGLVYQTRVSKRGAIQCYEDPVYAHLLEDPTIAEKLETLSIFDLTFDERMTLIDILREQLLTFCTFRDIQEERIVKLPDLRKQIKNLKLWDQEQEKASRIAAYAADELETPKNSKDKNIVKLRAYLKAVNENRRGVNPDDVKDEFLGNFPYDEFTAEEIRDFRDIQKTFFADKLEELAVENFETFCKIGSGFLGRDRSFRSYYYFEQYPIILVENVDNPGDCGEATPMKSDPDDPDAIISVMGCTGSAENCLVHSKSRPKWMYLGNEGDLDELINACNPRGFREIELVDSLTTFQKWLKPAVDNLSIVLQESANELKENHRNALDIEEENPLTNGHSEDIPMENGLDKSEPESRQTRSHSKSKTPDSTINNLKKKKNLKITFSSAAEFMGITDLKQTEDFQDNPLLFEVRKMITDMISKIDLQALGEFSFNDNQTSEEFLKALNNGENIKPFMVENDLKIHCYDEENIISSEEFDKLENSEFNQLMLAFFKVIHGVRQKFIKAPFTLTEKQRNNVTVIPTKAFVQWQQAIPECQSFSALALFITAFDSSVQWTAIKNTQKCPVCRKKTQAEDSVICDHCGNQYHMQCTPDEIESRVAWLCKACSRKVAPPKKRKPPSRYQEENDEAEKEAPPFVDANNFDEEEDEEEEEVAEKSTIDMDDVFQTSDSPPPNDDNNSSLENQEDGGGRNARVRRNKRPVDYSEYGESLLN